MVATTRERTFPLVEVGVDRYELERVIQEAFMAALGKEEVIGVHVSQLPHEYGAIVLLRHEPSAEAEALVLEQEEWFRSAGMRVGLLVRSAKRNAQAPEQAERVHGNEEEGRRKG